MSFYQQSVFVLLLVSFVELAEIIGLIMVSRVNLFHVKCSVSIQSHSLGRETTFLFGSHTLAHRIRCRMLFPCWHDCINRVLCAWYSFWHVLHHFFLESSPALFCTAGSDKLTFFCMSCRTSFWRRTNEQHAMWRLSFFSPSWRRKSFFNLSLYVSNHSGKQLF